MAALHEVLRYLHSRVPPATQDEHDRIAGLIDEDEHPGRARHRDDDGGPGAKGAGGQEGGKK